MDLEHVRSTLGLDGPDAGPKATASLRAMRSPIAPPSEQRRILDRLDLPGGRFEQRLASSGEPPLRAGAPEVLQVNLGRLCNMSCRHCHVDAGPDRVAENMDLGTAEQCIDLLDRLGVSTLDLTGGAPELNPHFRTLVEAGAGRGLHVIDRCNLTVLLLSRFDDLPEWLGERGVEIVASMPHHRQGQADAQRGGGAWERSIRALSILNAAGYGCGDPRRRLTLVANAAGAWLPAHQSTMEGDWKRSLARVGVGFDRLIVLNNMPIGRFLDWLLRTGNLPGYADTLARAFNPATVPGLMCRGTISVGWDGRVYDCDFNQVLDIQAVDSSGRPVHAGELDPALLAGREIRVGTHCFGCTAGAGSSCGGATAPAAAAR